MEYKGDRQAMYNRLEKIALRYTFGRETNIRSRMLAEFLRHD